MEKIIKIGSYVLVFLLPWQTRWIFKAGKINGGASEYLTYSLYAADVLLIALLVLAMFYLRKNIFARIFAFFNAIKKIEFFQGKNIEVMIIPLFLLAGLISIFFAENKALASFAEIRILLAVGFFWIIARFTQKSKVAVCFVLGLVGPAILAIWQFLTQQTHAFKWLGLAEHPAFAGGTSVIESYANGMVSGRWLRAYGSFDHPNMLGGALAIGLLVCLWLLIESRKETRHSRMTGENKKTVNMIFIYVSVVILSAGIFVSFSRSAWLALSLGITAGGIFLFFQKKFIDLKNWIFGAVIVAVVFVVLLLNHQELVNVRTQSEMRLEKLSLDQRKIYIKQAKELIFNNSITGVGIGNYVAEVERSNPGDPVWTYQPVHNVFLLVWAELGIFGVLLLLIFYMTMIWTHGRINLLMLVLLISLLPMMLFDHWLWSLHFGVLFFAIILGITVGFSEKEKV
ncbi:MAG: hypothetical protein ACD_67C00132G0003 [uncultured bacterium]|nr:MAG: hypothetical protein ACD_67C00132G0003 [uncultured bacterium]